MMEESKPCCRNGCFQKCCLFSCIRKKSTHTNQEATGAGDQDAVIRLPARSFRLVPPADVAVMSAERWTSAPTFINVPLSAPVPPLAPAAAPDRPRKRRSSPGRLDAPTAALIAAELHGDQDVKAEKRDLEK